MLGAWNPYVADIPAGSRRRCRYAATAAELNSRSVRRLFAVAEAWLIAAYNFAASIYYHGKAQRPENRTGLEPFIGAGAHRVLPDAARAEDARENASLDGDDE